jgi:hypothetical protein
MSRIEASGKAWADLQGPVHMNGAARPDATVVATEKCSQISKDWKEIISGPLAEWDKDREQLEDDDIVAPSRETLQRAVDIARELCALGLAAPQRVAATGDGSIVFARQEGAVFSNIDVMADGSAELTVFRDSRLVSRQRLF